MTEPEEIVLEDKNGESQSAKLWRSSAETADALVCLDVELDSDQRRALIDRGVHVLELTDLGADDRSAISSAERFAKWLVREADSEVCAVMGYEHSGTRAFLLGCTTNVADGIVVLDGPLALKELSRERPFQPLEMALGLECPLLAIYGQESESVSEQDRATYADVLSQFARSFDIVVRPGDGRGPLETGEWTRILSFLQDLRD